jgi:hypothetical protein
MPTVTSAPPANSGQKPEGNPLETARRNLSLTLAWGYFRMMYVL